LSLAASGRDAARGEMANAGQRIGVIGGGMAGLTAALRLAQAGHRVTLWERGKRLGGQAVAFEVDDDVFLEHFYHHLFQSDRDIVALIEELGIGDHLLWLPSNVGYFADGRIWPLNGALDLLRLGFIPFHDRLRIGLVTAYLQRVRNWRKFEAVTAEDWLRRALGQRAYDRTLGAQLRAKFDRAASEVAMVWFWGKIWLRTTSRRSPLDQEKLGYIRGSFNVLIDALTEGCRRAGVEIVTGTGPESLRQIDGGRWEALVDGQSHEVDAVVATVPSPILLRLAPDLPPAYAAKLTGARYEAAIVAILRLTHPLSDIYWLNIADDDLPFTGIIEHTNFMSPVDYNGKHYVYLGKYLETDHPYWPLSDDELIATYVPYLQRINPAFRPEWIERSWVFRERAAQPIIPLHYSERIPDFRTGLPHLYLANTSQIYPEDRGTNYSVRLGNRIAAMVDADLAASAAGTDADASAGRPLALTPE
ncbi:MAG TPA: NAD(P)/FAD-dependent oxidoreductase, partial [Thermomicrobiales bacterium]|nr:NAD(P)/FAD-dependent oxidoreductase [Thermomicrobiales bacterium]